MDRKLAQEDKKYRVGAIAINFPILYCHCVIDGTGTFLDGYYLETKQIMSEDQALISYELTFLIVGILVFSYLILVKKAKMPVKKEKYRTLAALCETIGQFFYVGAIASNSIVVAPMISSDSIVSVILSRLVLKEKLTIKQYLAIGMIMVAIAVLRLL
ncbi:DMT family transporter [uncultured Vagococcus sp.]|uniref:DMT family transporter n=1 Tax=uncultured Vagococcus sp. TaxID=189676 RepID=UPI0028D57783|nr:DMT family transporter [uncultured Vagococcus sp.]